MLSLSRGFANVLTRIALNNVNRTNTIKQISAFHTQNSALNCSEKQSEEVGAGDGEGEQEQSRAIDPAKDRTKAIPVETSIRYLQSSAYKQTYGDKFVWEQYRRNHKGQIPPRKTRKTCIRGGVISTGNPCPICRDEYLVLDHRNLDLLRQFISPTTGQVLSYSKTGLCQKSHLKLRVAVEVARDYGLISYDVPFREYDYSEYYPNYKPETSTANKQ